MKKKYILSIASSILVFSIACNIKPILHYTSELFWDIVCEQLNREEAERERRMANGELVRGRDTILIWGNLYEIGHYYDGNDLTLEGQEVSGCILENIKEYKVKGDKLYVISDDGYATIDRENICRVYMTEGEQISEKIEIEKILYLNSYEEFSNEEKKVFEKMSR